MLTLICEGTCNPSVRALDRLRETEIDTIGSCREGDEGHPRFARGTPAFWALQRRLVYTEHCEIGPDHYQCLTCGAKRRFGNSEDVEKQAA